jgi:hypothetical protein
LAAAADVDTTEVHPRFELPTGVAVLDGLDEEGFKGRTLWADGERRSASLPRLGGAEGVIVADRSGKGIRVSMRRMSCTLIGKVRLVNTA